MFLVGEVSVGDVSGWGNVCRGRIRRGTVVYSIKRKDVTFVDDRKEGIGKISEHIIVQELLKYQKTPYN